MLNYIFGNFCVYSSCQQKYLRRKLLRTKLFGLLNENKDQIELAS